MIKSNIKKTILILLLNTAIGYFTFIGVMLIVQRHFIYYPFGAPIASISLSQSGWHKIDVNITPAPELKIQGWFFAPSEPDKKVILLFHGNGGNISHRLHKILPYMRAGYGILLAEYRGYGGNPGKPSERGFYEDARAYYDWLLETGYAPQDIVLYGESLGTGVAVQMAVEYGSAALILETPYSSLPDAAHKRFFFIPFLSHLMHDKYANISKINHYNGPKLFLIAGQDEVLGKKTGLKLYNFAQEPKKLEVFDQAQHNTLTQFKAHETVLDFLSQI